MRGELPALLCTLLLSAPILANAESGPMSRDGEFAAGRPTPPGEIWAWRDALRGHGLGLGWVIGPAWYWSPFAVYPYPGVSPPPYLPPGYSYWCDFNLNYYPNVPYVPNCQTGWLVVPPR